MATRTFPGPLFCALAFLTLGTSTAAVVPGYIIAWGDNSAGQATPPAGLDDVIAVETAYSHCIALRANGTVVGWGSNTTGETNIPPGLTNVVAISAGRFCVALKADGTVVVWGSQEAGVTNIPPSATNLIAIEAASNGIIGLRRDGTVMGWGWAGSPSFAIPAGLSQVVEISGGPNHGLARKADGTIVGWGFNAYGQASSPPGVQTVRSIEAAGTTSLAVMNDFTVIKWGDPFDNNAVPPGLAGIAQIESGNQHVLARRTNGTVVAWGSNANGQGTVPEEITGVTSIAAGGYHNLVVTAQPRFISITPPVDASEGQAITFSVSATGGPLTYQWQHSGTNLPNQTNASLMIAQALPETAGTYTVIVSNAYGRISRSTQLRLPPPAITSQPVSWTVHRGEDVTFSVTASGYAPLTYRWFHGSTNIADANSAVLMLSEVDVERAGNYRVVVTDVTGTSVQSAEAVLSIIDPRPKTVVLKPVMDTSIYSGGIKPQGTTTLLAGRRRNGIVDRALLRFELGGIPTNALVQSAELKLVVVRAPNVNGYPLRVHRMLRRWDLGASWEQATAGQAWGAPGGAAGTDFTTSSAPGSSGQFVAGFFGMFRSSTNLITDLQRWIENPSENFGWLLINEGENIPSSARHFGSSESEYAPELTIAYETPAPVPNLSGPGRTGGSFEFQIAPTAGWFYTIETREHLNEGEWVVVTNLPGGAGLEPLKLSVPMTNQHRFFRSNRH